MLTQKVLKQTPKIDDKEMVLLYPKKNAGQLRVKPARYLKKIFFFPSIMPLTEMKKGFHIL